MTITRKQVADLREGDVVELRNHTWPDGTLVSGTLYEASGWLYVAEQPIRNDDGRPVLAGSYTLTVVSRAPRPLYVNHPRTEPTWGDVVRSAEPGDADDPSTWVHLPSDGYNVGLWASVTSSEDLIRCRQRHLPPRLRLLVDGETGQVVP